MRSGPATVLVPTSSSFDRTGHWSQSCVGLRRGGSWRGRFIASCTWSRRHCSRRSRQIGDRYRATRLSPGFASGTFLATAAALTSMRSVLSTSRRPLPQWHHHDATGSLRYRQTLETPGHSQRQLAVEFREVSVPSAGRCNGRRLALSGRDRSSAGRSRYGHCAL